MVFGAPIAFSVNPASMFSLALFFLYHANGYTTAATRYGRQRAAHCAPHRLAAKGRGHCLHHPASSAVALLPGVGGGGGGGGALALAFSFAALRLAGPNAVLSAFSLASSNPADPPVSPPRAPAPMHDLPRLAPHPATVAGTGTPFVDLNGAWASRGSAASPATLTVPSKYTLQGFRIPAGQPVAYRRALAVPASWAGLRAAWDAKR
jgi:hypothetical protein